MESIMGPVRKASKKWLKMKTIRNPEDLPEMRAKYPALSFVDCELIMLCRENNGILLSDDTKLIEIAEKEYEKVFGKGSWKALQSTSTLMPHRDMAHAIDYFWDFPGSQFGYKVNKVEELADENPE